MTYLDLSPSQHEGHLTPRHSSPYSVEGPHVPVLAMNGTQLAEHNRDPIPPTRAPPPRGDSLTPSTGRPLQPDYADTDGDDEDGGSLEETTGSITSVD